MKVSIVFGTRPEAIKLAPVIMRLLEVQWCAVRVVVTGQHDTMLKQVLEVFGIVPHRNLDIMRPDQSLCDVTTRALEGLDAEFRQHKSDLVIVQGDTTTTFVTALAAFYHQIPVAHVEAGLRTHTKYAPFPEEINRVLTTHIADWHYAPTERARQNLLREGIPADHVLVTGNTAIDALRWVVEQLDVRSADELKKLLSALPEDLIELCQQGRMILVTGHRRENFGAGFERI